MNIVGKLHVKMDTQQVSATFRKREFVVEYAENPQYPQFIKFEMIQDRCELIDPFAPGDKIDVSFNLRGREWTNPQGQKMYFTTLEAWRITKVAEAAVATPAGDFPNYSAQDIAASGADDLPF